MLRVRDGDVEILGALYERHRTRLFNLFLRLTGNPQSSEDLVQDVFLRMLKYRHTFIAGNPFSPWIFKMARNAHYDFRHKRRHELPQDVETPGDGQDFPSPAATPDTQVSQDQDVQLLQEALAGLAVESREALILSRFQGLKYEEIASVLNCGVGAVKMRVHRALKELRARFTILAGKEPR